MLRGGRTQSRDGRRDPAARHHLSRRGAGRGACLARRAAEPHCRIPGGRAGDRPVGLWPRAEQRHGPLPGRTGGGLPAVRHRAALLVARAEDTPRRHDRAGAATDRAVRGGVRPARPRLRVPLADRGAGRRFARPFLYRGGGAHPCGPEPAGLPDGPLRGRRAGGAGHRGDLPVDLRRLLRRRSQCAGRRGANHPGQGRSGAGDSHSRRSLCRAAALPVTGGDG